MLVGLPDDADVGSALCPLSKKRILAVVLPVRVESRRTENWTRGLKLLHCSLRLVLEVPMVGDRFPWIHASENCRGRLVES